jgi:hypothetical protein
VCPLATAKEYYADPWDVNRCASGRIRRVPESSQGGLRSARARRSHRSTSLRGARRIRRRGHPGLRRTRFAEGLGPLGPSVSKSEVAASAAVFPEGVAFDGNRFNRTAAPAPFSSAWRRLRLLKVGEPKRNRTVLTRIAAASWWKGATPHPSSPRVEMLGTGVKPARASRAPISKTTHQASHPAQHPAPRTQHSTRHPAQHPAPRTRHHAPVHPCSYAACSGRRLPGVAGVISR